MKYLYRIINALSAASIFPAAAFLDFVLVRASPSFLDVGVKESFSLKRIIDIFTGKDSLSALAPKNGSFSWPKALDPLKGALIGFVVCFVLALVTALFIIIWSIFSDARTPVFVADLTGLASTAAMILCFKSAAAKITSGAVNAFEALSSGTLGKLLGGAVKANALALAGFQNAMIIVFGFLLIWTAAFYVVEIGDEDEAKKRKAKKKAK